MDCPEERKNRHELERAGAGHPLDQHDHSRILSRRKEGESRRIVHIGGVEIGGNGLVVIAGPCAVESSAQIRDTALFVASAGARVLRGGSFKARTSPYAFQGLGIEGVRMMREAADEAGLPMVTEILSEKDLPAMEPYVDAFQVGSRNMDNTALLKELGAVRKPVVLKRGFAATITEWLLAAEYILVGGNPNVILCERGIRTFSRDTRFTLDLAGAVLAHQRSSLPVIIDPSHATGKPDLVVPLAAAAVAAGLDGLMVEVHPHPSAALSDAEQALAPESFHEMMHRVAAVGEAVGRPVMKSVGLPTGPAAATGGSVSGT
ncbi:MAG: 3-deoxy-7-phosphoheptulonate synthase [Bacteroidota bacterium]|nr:3-deoxy-7-phosphoheptulonate synthase [Bacteroidota bacterium]